MSILPAGKAGRGVLALLLSLATWGTQAANIPDRDDYAWGFPLSVTGDQGFHTANVPLSVYRSATDARLRDTGVYNTSGQPVPRIFRHLKAEDGETSRREPLAIIPLFRGQVDTPDDIRLRLRREAGETVLELDSHSVDTADAPTRILTAYIVQTGEFKQAVHSLEFSWSDTPEGFIGRVQVDGSDDLQHWRRIGRSTLARLSYADARIEENTTQLQGGSYDYLRITWRDLPVSWRLDGVTGVFSDQPPPAERDWLELDPVSHDSEAAEWIFDAGGFPPVDQVGLLLPPDNVLVRATVFHRTSPNGKWRRSYNGIFYHLLGSELRSGDALESPPVRVNTARSGQWKLRLDSGSVSGPVRLKLGWVPDRLSFVAQGEGPWELAVGRALDQSNEFDMLGDAAIFRLLEESASPGNATVGGRRVIGGEERLTPPGPDPWPKIGLWVGLIAAVGLVGWLVLSLLRDLRREKQASD